MDTGEAGPPDEGIWGGPVMIEDRADAVMFTIGLLRRLAAQHEPHSREWDYLLDSANTLEDLLEQQPGEGENMREEDKAAPIEDLIEASSLGTPGAKSLRARTTPEQLAEVRRRQDMQNRADAANKARIEKTGVELMNAFNRGKKDPSDMATHGHDTITGYEFYIERDGMIIRVELTRDRD